MILGHPDEAPAEDEPHAGLAQLAGRVAREAVAERRHHVASAVDEDHLGGRQSGERASGGPEEVLELGRDLDPGRPAADDHEGQEPATALGVGLGGRLLEHPQCAIAEVERVAEGAHAEAWSAISGTARKSVTLPSARTSAS